MLAAAVPAVVLVMKQGQSGRSYLKPILAATTANRLPHADPAPVQPHLEVKHKGKAQCPDS